MVVFRIQAFKGDTSQLQKRVAINAFFFHPSQFMLVPVVMGMAPKGNLTRTSC